MLAAAAVFWGLLRNTLVLGLKGFCLLSDTQPSNRQ